MRTLEDLINGIDQRVMLLDMIPHYYIDLLKRNVINEMRTKCSENDGPLFVHSTLYFHIGHCYLCDKEKMFSEIVEPFRSHNNVHHIHFPSTFLL